MDFKELHETIPYAKGGKEKVLRFSPYPNVTLALPGRHAMDTVPVGGDFVVMVTDADFDRPDHQFTHNDIFKDLEKKFIENEHFARHLGYKYLEVVQGADPDSIQVLDLKCKGIDPTAFLHAVQCLAVAEHRRYAKFEGKFGGRFLPLRFAAGIVEGLWEAADASNLQRKGRPGVEILEKQNGTPALTKELMS